MPPPPNTGMAKGAMRKLLNYSKGKNEPVGCAVGQGDDAKLALFAMHKMKRGKALEVLLKKDFPNAKLRHGTALVNEEENPKLVLLSLNRGMPGVARKLIKTLKGTGFTKVRIVTDDGETEDYEEEDDTPVAAEEAAADEDEEADAAPPPAPPPPPPPPPSPPPAATASPADSAAQAAGLAKLLAGLAPRIPAVAGDRPEVKATLLKLATDANVAIKTGNLKAAAIAVQQLKSALEQAPAAAAPAAAAPADLAKLRLDWVSVRDQVAADVDTLRDVLAQTYAGLPVAAEIATRFNAKADPLLAKLDDRLAAALDEVTKAPDAARRAELTTVAKAVVKDYLTFASTDPFIGDIDSNPFVPLSVRKKAVASLSAVAQAIA